jgi:hypothetical protein
MLDKLSSVFFSGLLFLLLFNSQESIYVLVGSAVALMVAILAMNLRKVGLAWSYQFISLTYIAAVFSGFILVPNQNLRLIFLIISAILFYFVQINLGKQSQLLQNVFLGNLFVIYVAIFSLQHYQRINLWVFLGLVTFLTFIFSVQGFAGFSTVSKKYFIFVLTFLAAQASLALFFWPVLFLTKAVVLFFLFYLFWSFAVAVFFGKLTKKKIILQSGIVFISLVLLLVSAAWQKLLG